MPGTCGRWSASKRWSAATAGGIRARRRGERPNSSLEDVAGPEPGLSWEQIAEGSSAMPGRISAEEASSKLNDLLDQVSSGNGAVTIERKGKPLAVLITPEQWERYQQLSKEDFFRVVDELRRENQDKDPEEVY